MRLVDTYSLILAFIVVQLAALGALGADLMKDPERRDLSFLSGRVLQIIGWTMIFYRDVLPDGLSVLVGNCAMFAGICLDSASLVAISGGAPRYFRRIYLSAWLLFSGAVALEPLGLISREAIFLVGTLVHGALMVASGWFFVSCPRSSPLRRVLTGFYLSMGLVLGFRAVWLTSISRYALSDPALPQVLSILGAFAISTVSAISYGLLKKEMALRQVRIMADQDPLTHLYNRRAFTRIGEDLFRRARQEGTPLWAMMIDIDHFKSINDTFGHSAGDEIIADLAFIMAKVLPCHLTCRYGGEEFGALLTGLSDPQALETAEMIRAEAERASVMGISYTVSVGLAKLEGQKTMYALLDDADAALYRAKGLGRNRVEVFHQDMIPRERDLEAVSADQGIGG